MNCIILLLLLSCCGGWGNFCGCGTALNDRGCGCREGGRGRNRVGNGSGRRDSGRGGDCGRNDSDRRDSGRGRDLGGRNSDRRDSNDGPGDCGCMEGRSGRDGNDCACPQNDRGSCDIPGMIPPPWQEYPAFPRRDNRDGRDDCDSDK